MSKVRSSKADAMNAQKSGGHHQENNKSSHHTAAAEDSSKSGTPVESLEPEVKQAVLPAKEPKLSKASSKSSKRIAEAAEKKESQMNAEKKESQMNAENGVTKSKNKKTENGEHSDKKDMTNNGLTAASSPKDESDEDIKLLMEEDEQHEDSRVDNASPEKAKVKANGSSQEKTVDSKQNDATLKDGEKGRDKESEKSKDKDKKKDKNPESESKMSESKMSESKMSEAKMSESLNDSQANAGTDSQKRDSQENETMMRDEDAEQSFHNMSFGRTLRKISGRRSMCRLDRNSSMNSSMFVNTSTMSTLNDEAIERKLSQYRSGLNSSSAGLKRKASEDEEEPSPEMKRIKPEGSSFFSFTPYAFFQNLRRPVQVEVELNDIDKQAAPPSAATKCNIM